MQKGYSIQCFDVDRYKASVLQESYVTEFTIKKLHQDGINNGMISGPAFRQ